MSIMQISNLIVYSCFQMDHITITSDAAWDSCQSVSQPDSPKWEEYPAAEWTSDLVVLM